MTLLHLAKVLFVSCTYQPTRSTEALEIRDISRKRLPMPLTPPTQHQRHLQTTLFAPGTIPYGFPVLTTNCSNNYGPRQFPEKLIPLIIHNAIAGKELPIYGDGKNVRDWLYVEDHCSALYSVMTKGELGETYNIGGNCEIQNIEIVRAVCSILNELRPKPDGTKYDSQIMLVKYRPGHDRRYAIDASKIKKNSDGSHRRHLRPGSVKPLNGIWKIQNG